MACYGDLCSRRGTSFIDLIVAMGIIAVLFGAIISVYFAILSSVNNIEVRSAAAALLNQQIETIRNLPYNSVGTVGGVPVGIIPQQQTLALGNFSFVIQADVRNIDDPFDGTLTGGGGVATDTAPNDYKLLTLTVSCPWCVNFVPLSVAANVAPKNLESAGQNGSLFVGVLDASGHGVPLASVQVTNTSVTPSINLADTTNGSGTLQLIGVPTSTQSYHIVVTKGEYSSDQTYKPGDSLNPNPSKPDATVALQEVTSVTFLIDKTSHLNISSQNNFCVSVPNAHFAAQGLKTIGSNPTVYKFSTSSVTDASGVFSYTNLEWDTYALSLNDSSYDLAGTIPLSPLIVNPSSTVGFKFVVQPAAHPALLVTVTDAATGAGILGASVNISKDGFSRTQKAGYIVTTQSDWSGGGYSSQDGGIDTYSSPGSLELAKNASGTYDTGITHWLISTTIDLGSSSSVVYSLSWNPVSQLPETGPQSVKFQIAANNDGATWNFIGPNGTGGSYYTSTSTLGGFFDGYRYLRYRVFMSTESETASPSVQDVSLEFHTSCVPSAQTLFTSLPQGTYSVVVNASGYVEATSSVSVGSGFGQAAFPMVHL